MTKIYVEVTIMVPLHDFTEAGEILRKKLGEIKREFSTPKKRYVSKNKCKVDECNEPHSSRGYCRRHYTLWYANQPKDDNGKLITTGQQELLDEKD